MVGLTCIARLGVAAAVSVAAILWSMPAQAALSEYLSRKIAEAHGFEANRQFDLALSLYKQAIEQEGHSGDDMRLLLKKRAAVFEQINILDKAEADLSAALKVEPLDPSGYADRGYFYLRQSRFDPALSDFVTGSRFEPDNPLYLYGAARVMVAAKDFANAVNFYSEAIAHAPEDARFHLARAEAYVHLKQFAPALVDYERAFTLGLAGRTDRFFGFAGRGFANLALGDQASAIRNFDAALGIDPEAQNVLVWRGYAQERRGQRDLALADYERALQLMPASAAARDSLRRLRSVAATGAR